MAEWTRDTPWRQGLLLDADAIGALGLQYLSAPHRIVVMVATHDCDLAQAPDVEPRIEVVVGCFVEEGKKDGNFTHAKNSRKLHIEFTGGASLWAEFEAIGKLHIPKEALTPFSPRSDVRLSPENLATLQFWLASRYRRSAFSDEFERRMTKETNLAEKIAKAVKPHGGLIAGVFFDVDDGEEVRREGPNDPYKLDITILHAAEPDFMAAFDAATNVSTAITKVFNDKLFSPGKVWQQIELRSCEAISESVLAYQEFKRLKRWRLEHISLGSDPQQQVLAE